MATDVFDGVITGPNQIKRQLNSYDASSKDLTVVPDGTRTDFGFRRNISVTLGKFKFTFIHTCLYFVMLPQFSPFISICLLGYLDSWLRGVGCVPLYNLMEDAATAEISRAQLWQWLRHEARLEGSFD